MSSEAISRDREGRFSRIIQSQATARIVLVVSLALTAAAWYVAREAVHGGAEDRFEFQTQELQDAITDRMIVYEQVLWGGTGLFNA
ncbi:MAG: hypothetical protein HKN24_00030, partial [Acidimicrobiales bacterium]|nr:hypothetical protein [Acidimicrobiales bacterium]